jgi:hypothetical protein
VKKYHIGDERRLGERTKRRRREKESCQLGGRWSLRSSEERGENTRKKEALTCN